MRLIRWVGHPSPFDDQNWRKLLVLGVIPDPMIKLFKKFEHSRKLSAVIGSGATFSVGLEHGFSRSYLWNPQETVPMEDQDWERLGRNPIDRFMFLDVTDNPSMTLNERRLTKRQWEMLFDAMEKTPPPTTLLPPSRPAPPRRPIQGKPRFVSA